MPEARKCATWRTRAVREALHAEIQARLGEKVARPDMGKAKDAQEALLPHDQDGRLIPLGCPLETFRIFGAGVYGYVCWMKFMEKCFLVAFAFSLPNLFYNIAGGKLDVEDRSWMTIPTLGNVEEVSRR
uniref:Uncharacterized protein n=1 Tax=Haptolina brevifila TaxID=156173 RepID=A0A6U7DN20_9EUKA|mmetsp:Transcript_27403/g.55151  ORF Transcript_27403/g.55151 Transcript_27403/m.55151 type:complete len:129 (+) Transcript_27403:195-581(+)